MNHLQPRVLNSASALSPSPAAAASDDLPHVADAERIEQMIALMVACHGDNAESVARKRARRCLRRKELEWAATWYEVARHIAERRAPQM